MSLSDSDSSMDSDLDAMSDIEENILEEDSNIIQRLQRDAIQPVNAQDSDVEMDSGHEEDEDQIAADEVGAAMLDVLDEVYLTPDEHLQMTFLIQNRNWDNTPIDTITIQQFRHVIFHRMVPNSSEQREWQNWLGSATQFEHYDFEEEAQAVEADQREREDDQEVEFEGELEWIQETIEQGDKIVGTTLMWNDLQPYIDMRQTEDREDIDEYMKIVTIPTGPLAPWLEDGGLPYPDHHKNKHVTKLILDVLGQAADERIEVYEEQLDENDAVQVAGESLSGALGKFISRIHASASLTPSTDGSSSSSSSVAPVSPVLMQLQSSFDALKHKVDQWLAETSADVLVQESEPAKVVSTSNEEEKMQDSALPTDSTSSSSTASPSRADRLAQRVAERQTFLSTIHEEILSLLADEDVPLGLSSAWPEYLRSVATKVEQSHTSPIIPLRVIESLTREVAQDFKNDLEFEPEAFEAIQEAAEHFLSKHFDLAGAALAESSASIDDTDAVSRPVTAQARANVNQTHLFRTADHVWLPHKFEKVQMSKPAPPKPLVEVPMVKMSSGFVIAKSSAENLQQYGFTSTVVADAPSEWAPGTAGVPDRSSNRIKTNQK